MHPHTNELRHKQNSFALSAAVHVCALLAMAGVLRGSAKLRASRLPGTRSGVQFLTYYAPGSTRAAVAVAARAKAVAKAEEAVAMKASIELRELKAAPAALADRGLASSGQSGLGDGNITIALEKYFPPPKPSLDSLMPGSAGDVILKAVIDEHGKIAGLTLLAGLGPAIDDAVIQTVNQWVYTPAMKDGVPVASVEELHFHYERRG